LASSEVPGAIVDCSKCDDWDPEKCTITMEGEPFECSDGFVPMYSNQCSRTGEKFACFEATGHCPTCEDEKKKCFSKRERCKHEKFVYMTGLCEVSCDDDANCDGCLTGALPGEFYIDDGPHSPAVAIDGAWPRAPAASVVLLLWLAALMAR